MATVVHPPQVIASTAQPRRWLLPVTLLVFGALAAVYYIPFASDCGAFCVAQHESVLNGTADAPLRYRILMPFIVDRMFPEPLTAYALAHLIALPALCVVLFYWLKRSTTALLALVGVMALMLYLPLMFRVYAISLYNPVELILLCAALLIRRGGWGMLALVVIGAFNRETTALLILGGYAALNFDALRRREAQAWRWLVVYAVTFAAIYAGLRLALGPAPEMVTVADAWQGNTGGGWHTETAAVNHLLLLPLWLLALAGWHDAPDAQKRLALVSLPYIALFLIFGFWNEIRLMMPLWALVLPLSLRGLAQLTADR